MPHIAELQTGWTDQQTSAVVESIKEAMQSPTRSRSTRVPPRPSVESPRDLPAPEPHLPLRKASAHSRLHLRKGPVPKPLFTPSRGHRGFNPSPVQPPVPHIDNITASSEHAFAGKEPKRRQHAVGVLENQTVLQYAETAPDYGRREGRPPSSPLQPPPLSPISPAFGRKGKSLKSSKSMGDGMRGLRHRASNKQHDMYVTGPRSPDSLGPRPSTYTASDEIRQSFRSALTSHSSLGHTSSLNTAHTSLSQASSHSESFVKVQREDWDDGGLTDVDMSVEDAIGMYEDGFESGAESTRASMDRASMQSVDDDRPSEERYVPMERSYSQPDSRRHPNPLGSLPNTPTHPDPLRSQPNTPSYATRPKIAHRRSQSASILLSGIPKSARPGTSPNPTQKAPLMTPLTTPATGTTPLALSGQANSMSDAVPRDRYGFKKASQYVTVEQYDAWNATYSAHIARRSKKWHVLMRSYGLTTESPLRFPPKSEKIKRYVRKGIPPEYRGAAWFWYAGGPGKLVKHPGLYWSLVEKTKLGDEFLSDNDREHIERDLNRTFPDNVKFKPDPTTTHDAQAGAGGGNENLNPTTKSRRQTQEAETPILQALRRLLQAFAIHNPQIGYCQSLNFIAGLLLIFLNEDEEKCFILLNIVTAQHLPGTHGVALEGANIDIAVLMSCIKDTLPAVWNRLDDKAGGSDSSGGALVNGVKALSLPTISLATTAWFMSLFVGTLPIESVLRVWDCLFFEGSKTLFRIALAIFKSIEPHILAVSDPMEIFQVVQTVPRGMLDINGLMEVCFRRRGGFGGVSQGLIEVRRAERRRIVKEGVIRAREEESAFRKLRGRLKRNAKTG